MFLIHLWATGYAAPPELGFTRRLVLQICRRHAAGSVRFGFGLKETITSVFFYNPRLSARSCGEARTS